MTSPDPRLIDLDAVRRAVEPHLNAHRGLMTDDDRVSDPTPVRRSLHQDPWMMDRISKALDAIRYADAEGLETELDLLAFADDVLDRYAQTASPSTARV